MEKQNISGYSKRGSRYTNCETVFESSTVITASIFQTPKLGQYVIRYVVTAQDGDMNVMGDMLLNYEKQDSERNMVVLKDHRGFFLSLYFSLESETQSST